MARKSQARLCYHLLLLQHFCSIAALEPPNRHGQRINQWEKEKHGSFDGYIREGLGLSEKEIEALRSSLLE